MGFRESGFEFVEGLAETVLHRTGRDIEGRCSVFEREALVIMQVDGETMVFFEFLHGGIKLVRRITVGRRFKRTLRGISARLPPFIAAFVVAVGTAAPIHISIVGDAVEPRVERTTTTEALERLPDATECLLAKVGGSVIAAAKPAQIGVDALVMRVEQRRRCLEIAALHPSAQFFG